MRPSSFRALQVSSLGSKDSSGKLPWRRRAMVVPEGFTLHTENTTHILLPNQNDAFLNPVQEFNRDLSVACITVWSEGVNAAKEAAWRSRRPSSDTDLPAKKARSDGAEAKYHPHRFTMLEPLSATGLRSIRFAKEIPLLKCVVANDISPAAVEAIRRNVEYNGVGYIANRPHGEGPSNDTQKVAVEQGDACALMYLRREKKNQAECIDLDPYGTVSPFVDGAVQAVADGGLLCVTCTDLAVLATNNYPEKCYANYGGVPAKAEYCHEIALRLVLHLISSTAARYGRCIEPLLSLSIDFYVRLFVRVRTSPIDVKRSISQTGLAYICTFCQSHSVQFLGRRVEKPTQAGGVNVLYRQSPGPPCNSHCDECGSVMHLAGPMWFGPLHDKVFVDEVLTHVERSDGRYQTALRMKGMLTVVKEELESPFYFTPTKVASFFGCVCPSLEEVASALLNGGHEISRSHASPGSLKTTASSRAIHDVFRAWIKDHPVVMKNIPPDSPKHKLLASQQQTEVSFERHPLSSLKASATKLVRYQQNPEPFWGPGTKAKKSSKRKLPEDGSDI